MKYRRIEKLDQYYLQADDDIRKQPPELKFYREPGLYYRPANADRGTKYCNCKSCNTTRHFTEFVPLHRKSRCMEWANLDKFTPVYYTSFICVHCLIKLHEQYKSKYGLDDWEALYAICALLDVYYDHNLAQAVYNDHDLYFEDGQRMNADVHWIDRYFRLLEVGDFKGQTFWGSDNLKFYESMRAAKKEENSTQGMSDDERNNYNQVLSLYHYDPFTEDDPKDRPRLIADLVTMMDDAMADDVVRMRAALEIVRAFNRIDKINNTLIELQATPESNARNARQIKELIDTKKKETDMVTAFSKDHGFAEKYANSKSKGSGTLGAVIRDMKAANYDFGTVNKYDIETSAAIQQVSDISAESIFKQLGLTSVEYSDMVRQQAVEIKNLQSELRAKEEELRLFKEKELKQEILEELRDELIAKKIPTQNVDDMIAKELNKNRVIPPL